MVTIRMSDLSTYCSNPLNCNVYGNDVILLVVVEHQACHSKANYYERKFRIFYT